MLPDPRAPDHGLGDAASDLAHDRRWTRAARLLVAVVLALLVHGAWRVGPTYDEHFYLASGRAYLHTADFGLNREHPPLLKYMAGVPLLALGVEPTDTWRDETAYPAAFVYARHAADLDRNVFAARLPFCLLAALTVWVLFRVGRAWFGARAGFVGAALLGLNPNWLANGRLAALDGGSAALIFVALIAAVRAFEEPSARRTLRAAVLFGVANLAKFTALLLGPACIALAALAALIARRVRPLLVLAGLLFGGLGVFAAGYGFEARPLNALWAEPNFPARAVRSTLAPGSLARRFAAEVERSSPRPAGAAEFAARLGEAPDEAAALELLGARLASAETQLDALVLAALEALVGADGDLRRTAVASLLAPTADDLPNERRLALVADLAERDADFDLAGWRAWFDRAQHDDWDERIFATPLLDRLTRGLLGDRVPVPLVSALKGIDYQLRHGADGHASYFKGVTLRPGTDFADGNPFPEYYAVVMGVKNPLAFLALCGLGVACALRAPRRFGSLRLAACLVFPAACFWLFSSGNALMGVRYVLPVFPFLALLAARAAEVLPRTALALTAVAAAESLWIHPHELMYFNAAIGGPRHGPELTVVGDDWGQDVRAVGRFLERNADALAAAGGLVYEPYTVGDPAAFGLESTRVPRGPERAIVAVHLVHYWREREKWAWLDAYEPFHHIGHSVLLFDTRAGPPGADPGLR
jgi:4-amino-4-deoxy-L-arabinose transferase-like glycosyltransferase